MFTGRLVQAAEDATTYGDAHAAGISLAGATGILCYLGIRRLSNLAETGSRALAGPGSSEVAPTGRRALMLFVYLELLDATFSFDSVMGGFSVTLDVVLFVLGLGFGAAFVRCMTVQLVRRRALERYRYLEQGAYYSIGVLAVLLFVQIGPDVPDWIASVAGTSMIGASFVHSALIRRGEERSAKHSVRVEG